MTNPDSANNTARVRTGTGPATSSTALAASVDDQKKPLLGDESIDMKDILEFNNSTSDLDLNHPDYDFLNTERCRKARKGPTLIFDGVCHLCNGAMRWYYDRIPRNQEMIVNFMWMQHPDTKRLVEDHYGIHDGMSSWVYIENDKTYRGSTAWLRSLRHLKLPWSMGQSFLCVPECIREVVYGCVARNRYNWFGQSDEFCKRPPQGLKDRILHSFVVPDAQPQTQQQQDKKKD